MIEGLKNPAACSCTARVLTNEPVSRGLMRLDLELPLNPGFLPGQFAMLNLTGSHAWVFGRPLSILAWRDATVSFLYRVVGRGTGVLAECGSGTSLSFLGPLGRPFPEAPDNAESVLIAGGVGLPPLYAWAERFAGSPMLPFFGAREGGDVPWSLLGNSWRVSVEDDAGLANRTAAGGLVTDLVAETLPPGIDDKARIVLACGPWPLLRAVHRLTLARGWRCWLSLEEHMGCGYGACKGCVVPVRAEPGSGPEDWRPATCCAEGPVFPAEALVWSRLP